MLAYAAIGYRIGYIGDDMTTRRDKGSGSVYQRASDGRYIAAIDLGWGVDGKRKRKTVSGRTKAEAMRKKVAVERDMARHGVSATGNTTVKAYLEEWLTTVRVKPTTLATYRNNVRRYLIPTIGRRRLDQLEPQHVRDTLRWMEREGLSPATVNGAHRVLRAALSDAVNDQRIPRNVAKNVAAPSPTTKEADSLTAAHARRLLRSLAVTDPLAARWAVALLLGIRQGEALGMEWSRLDLDVGTLDLSWQLQRLPYRHGCNGCGNTRAGSCPQRELAVPADFDHRVIDGALCLTRPKSQAGWRIIPLPAFVVAALINHHDAHGAALSGLVFTRDGGRPYDPAQDNHAWHAALGAAGLPQVKLHAARHTTATLLLELGVDPKVIQAILGHSTVVMTRAYQHASIEMQRRAMDSMAGLFEIED
jgi:integrase